MMLIKKMGNGLIGALPAMLGFDAKIFISHKSTVPALRQQRQHSSALSQTSSAFTTEPAQCLFSGASVYMTMS